MEHIETQLYVNIYTFALVQSKKKKKIPPPTHTLSGAETGSSCFCSSDFISASEVEKMTSWLPQESLNSYATT